MSIAKISTESINNLVTKARIMKSTTSKGSHFVQINGHNCEVKNGQLNVVNLAQAFNIDHNIIKQWKTKNAAYLTKTFGDQDKKNKSEDKIKLKPIMDNGANYIEPRFALQCLMGSDINFNNFITNIVLGSLLYCDESNDDNLFNIQHRLEETIPGIQKEFEKKCTPIQKESPEKTKSSNDVNKIMVIAFPTDVELNTPFIKFFNSDKLSDNQINKLKKRGKNENAYELVEVEFSNNPKLKEGVEQYLVDNQIKHETSNIQISLTNSFTLDYYNSIEEEMYKSIEDNMTKLYDESKKNLEIKRATKKTTKKAVLEMYDENEAEEVDEIEEKQKPVKQNKRTTKKSTKKSVDKKEPKEEKQLNKPSSRSASKTRVSGKFNSLAINDDDFDFDDDM